MTETTQKVIDRVVYLFWFKFLQTLQVYFDASLSFEHLTVGVVCFERSRVINWNLFEEKKEEKGLRFTRLPRVV